MRGRHRDGRLIAMIEMERKLMRKRAVKEILTKAPWQTPRSSGAEQKAKEREDVHLTPEAKSPQQPLEVDTKHPDDDPEHDQSALAHHHGSHTDTSRKKDKGPRYCEVYCGPNAHAASDH